ncbi:molybdopterin-containing oxidoreductase family protein [Haliangium sp.]|uniref:molybdopterin-containing oxidoreductase family protein n=1 Tax=Haliangium sp. TaxID=2663208 RepID=UPI003D11E4EC
MRRVPSACPLDCPDLCSLNVDVEEVEDGADGDAEAQTIHIDGNETNPLTAGFICGKVNVFGRHVYCDERLRYPMIRTGAKGEGAFRRASWDEALTMVTERIRATVDAHGGEAILPYSYGGCNGYLTNRSVDARLFRRLGASRLARTVCAAPSHAALSGLYGDMAGVALEDYVHAELIVLWGVNPSFTGIHLVPMVHAAQERGARLIVVDPRVTPMAQRADLHIAPRPGTDLPIALALLNTLFEQGAADELFLARHAHGVDTLRARAAEWPLARAAEVAGVTAAELGRFATMYAEASPAVIRCGWGQERNRNGGGATAAILALPAVAGKFGVRGGGYTQSNGNAWQIPSDAAAAAPEADTRTINMNHLGRVLAPGFAPPVELLFVYNNNPLATSPNQEAIRAGLEREDLFTVVYEQVMTDTARYADVLLPATTFLEHRELRRGYGSMRMFDARPAIAPVGEARPNYEVFAELIERLGLGHPEDPTSLDELVAQVIARTSDPRAVAEGLERRGMADRPGGATPVQFEHTFPTTPSGKVELVPAHLDEEAPGGLYTYAPDPATEQFPLALISPAQSRTISSTFGQLLKAQVPVELHPDDAAARGIADGDRVRVFNQLGEVRCLARLTSKVRPGVVCLPKGLWAHNTESGTTANALCPDDLSDIGAGACFNDARVEIARLG